MAKKLRYPIIIFVLALDQLIKYLIRGNFEVYESREFIGKICSLTYVQNRGVAFSLLTGKGLVLIAIPIIVSAIAVIYMEEHRDEHWTLFPAASLIIAGGIGNVIDRLTLGFVTDMFDFHFWPVFNVADISITFGCGFLIIYVLFFMKDDKKGKKQKDDKVI